MIPLEIKKDFETFTKICINCGRFGQNNCCHRLWKVAQCAINRPIWSHWSQWTPENLLTYIDDIDCSQYYLRFGQFQKNIPVDFSPDSGHKLLGRVTYLKMADLEVKFLACMECYVCRMTSVKCYLWRQINVTCAISKILLISVVILKLYLNYTTQSSRIRSVHTDAFSAVR